MLIHDVFYVPKLFRQRVCNIHIQSELEPVCLSIYPYPSVCLRVFVHLSVSPSLYQSVCLSARPSFHLPVSPSVCKITAIFQSGCGNNENTICCTLARAWSDVIGLDLLSLILLFTLQCASVCRNDPSNKNYIATQCTRSRSFLYLSAIPLLWVSVYQSV